jgi:hypothetical protein
VFTAVCFSCCSCTHACYSCPPAQGLRHTFLLSDATMKMLLRDRRPNMCSPLLAAAAATPPDTYARLAHAGPAALPPLVQKYFERCTPSASTTGTMQRVLDSQLRPSEEDYWQRQQFQLTAAAAGNFPMPPPLPGEAVARSSSWRGMYFDVGITYSDVAPLLRSEGISCFYVWLMSCSGQTSIER